MNTPTKPWHTVQLEHQVISESPRKVIYRFSDEPEKIYTTMEHAMRVRSLPQEVPPLSEHHMEDEIEDKDRYISSLKRIIWELTENKLKSADAQKGILQYSLFTKAVAKALGLPTFEINLMDLTNRIENLVGWKKEALAELEAWDLVVEYLRKSPDLTIGDTYSEKCLEFLRERDAFVRERNKLRVLLEKPVSE